MTLRLIDFMINRTHLNIFNKTNGLDALRGIAEIMRNSFDWSEQEYQEQIEEYLEFVEKTNFAYS